MADDRNAPATKGDIEDLRSEMKETMTEQIAMIRSEMQHMHDDLIERARDTETRLLEAFYAFAKTNQARQSATEQETAALKERLSIVETRLIEVERRLNLPPAAA
jgi:cell division septum initiation protein DivIVA